MYRIDVETPHGSWTVFHRYSDFRAMHAQISAWAVPAGAKLPPLECLFTVDEETGLSGAFGLDGSMVRGVRLVNLDTEDWGDLYVYGFFFLSLFLSRSSARF